VRHLGTILASMFLVGALGLSSAANAEEGIGLNPGANGTSTDAGTGALKSSCEQEITRLTNEERQIAGVPSLNFNAELSQLSRVWAEWMVATKQYVHLSAKYPYGKDFWGAVGVVGAGENIYLGDDSAQTVINFWMSFPKERANILNSAFTEMGIGCASDGTNLYWVQQFGESKRAPVTAYTRMPIPTDHLIPKVDGVMMAGGTINADVGGRLPAKTELTYEWFADGKPLKDAKESSYTLTDAEIGKVISVRAKATNDPKFYEETAISFPKTPIIQHPTDFVRMHGRNRYETSLSVFRAGWRTGATLFVASGEKFPDSLTAVPAVNQEDGSLLLTAKDGLSESQISYLSTNIPGKAFIIGGPNSVSNSVINQLNALGINTTRISGADRFETSLRVTKTFFEASQYAYLASGTDFPDALSAGGAAGAVGAPILLARPTDSWLDFDQALAMLELGVKELRIAGGKNAVSVDLEISTRNDYKKSFKVVRLGGADRYETATLVNKQVFGPASRVWLASGEGFPDALSAGAAAGARGEPLYLSKKDCLPGSTFDSVESHRPLTRVIVGGPTVLDGELWRCS